MARKKKDNTNIKIVELNNKSRKGKYVYIRKNGHTHYYKYHEGMKPKGIVRHYLKELKKIREKGTQAGRKILVPKKKRIEAQFKKGIPEIDIKDARITTQNLHKLKERMFKSSIKNKKLLKTIVKDNNLEKVKHRFEIIATINGVEGEQLATISKTGITPDQALKEINKTIRPGEYMDSSPGMRDMNEKGWTGNLQRTGTVKNVSVKIIFRKER